MNDESGAVRVKEFTIAIETPDGRLPPARVSVPDIAMTLGEVVPPAQQLADGCVRLAVDAARRTGREISCRKGCGACCVQLVPLSIPELCFMVSTVREQGAEYESAVRSRFGSLESALREQGLWEKLEGLSGNGDDSAAAAEYFSAGIPCPFVENGACSIHPWRPVACREYNVISPPSHCSNPLTSKVERIRIHRRMTTALAKLASEFLESPVRLIPMPMLYSFWDNHPELNKASWPAPVLFDRMLTHALGTPA
jgi:Fe-S-cluster containining protein